MQEREIKKCLAGMGVIFVCYVLIIMRIEPYVREITVLLAVSLITLFAMAGWSVYCLYTLCGKIRHGADILAEIVGESRKETLNEARALVWKDYLTNRFLSGAIGDLYSRIWECALVSQERAASSHKEQKYLREMMTDISHQIKTPLAALQVFLDIFQKDWEERNGESSQQTTDSHSLEKMYEQANAQIQRMQWLVMGLLKCTQLESGVSVLHREKKYLGSTVAACVEALTTLWEQREQHVVISGEPEICFSYDEEWLSEAIMNILKNACEHAPIGSEVRISWQQNSMATRLEIEDRGDGIPQEELPKIFNRFYRGQGEYRVGGVGIGLALAKDIVERHGGSIIAESQTGEVSFTRFTMLFLQEQ